MNRGVELCSTALFLKLLKMAGNFTSKNSGNKHPPPPLPLVVGKGVLCFSSVVAVVRELVDMAETSPQGVARANASNFCLPLYLCAAMTAGEGTLYSVSKD